MKSSVDYFHWPIPVDGFQWEDGQIFPVFNPTEADKAERRFLLMRTYSREAKRTFPLAEHPKLFQTFADLDPTEDAFLSFANTYGSLGVALPLVTSSDEKAMSHSMGPRGNGEPLWRWKNEHFQMRPVARMLAAIEARDLDYLKSRIHLREKGVSYECEDPTMGLHYEWLTAPSIGKDDKWLMEWAGAAANEVERLTRFASAWAQNQINKAMSGGTERQTSVRILFNDEKMGLRVHIVPDTLLAAMWLQCARVLTENYTFRQCENCGKWYELSADARKKRSRYCSDRCRVAANRSKRVHGADVSSWMNEHYFRLRRRPDWIAMTEPQQIETLKAEIRSREKRNPESQLRILDRDQTWPQALHELEDRYESYRSILEGNEGAEN